MFGSRSKKFVLTIGDDGVILTFLDGAKLKERLFCQAPSSEDAEKLKKLLERNRSVPIYIYIDLLDQSFSQQTIPPISALRVNALVKRKLQRDFNPNDIKAALKLDRLKTGRKDWIYLFLSIPFIPPLSEWIEMMLEMPNKFAGIYSLPLEVEALVRDIDKLRKGSVPAQWKMLIAHNKVGGIRQVVYRNNTFIISRLNQPVGAAEAGVIAGNIEQEAANTIEFIRRVGYEEKDGLDLYVICEKDIKSQLQSSRITAVKDITVFTPHELATKLGMKNVTKEEDKYSDILLAAHFGSKKRKHLRISTKNTEQLDKLDLLDNAAVAGGSVLVLLMLLLGGYYVVSLYSIINEFNQAKKLRGENEIKLEEINKEKQKFSVDINAVIDTVYYYNVFSKNEAYPLNMLSQFSEVKGKGNSVKTVRVKMDEMEKSTPPNAFGKDLGVMQPRGININYSMELKTSSNTIEQLLEYTENFTKKIQESFKGYDIKFSNLPSREIINTNIGGGALPNGPDLRNVTIQVIIETAKSKEKQ